MIVGWGFRINNQQFACIDMKDLEKPRLSPLGYRYLSAVLLTNMRTCLNGMNPTSEYFDYYPPTLDEYLSAPRDGNPRAGAQYDLWGDGVQGA